jgi:hypothetical protein
MFTVTQSLNQLNWVVYPACCVIRTKELPHLPSTVRPLTKLKETTTSGFSSGITGSTAKRYEIFPFKGRFTSSTLCPCRAHAVPLPCRAAEGLECVFPILFTQCGRFWFTLAMPRPCHALTMPFFSRPRHRTACGLPARVRLLPATTRSSTKIVIRSIPVILTTIRTYDCKEWQQHTTKRTIC